MEHLSLEQTASNYSNPSLVNDFETGSPWYVAQTKPRQESTAVMNLHRQGYKTYLPMLANWKKRHGQWCRVHEVCFPRYIFFSPGKPQQSISPVRSTQGVSSLVTFGQIPATIGGDVLVALNQLEQMHIRLEVADKPTNPFAVGDTVRIESGPLAGLTGIVSVSSTERVAVMLSLLGREKSVSIAANALSRL
jgi:transcriptional antiterminator RfaH